MKTSIEVEESEGYSGRDVIIITEFDYKDSFNSIVLQVVTISTEASLYILISPLDLTVRFGIICSE